MTAPTFLEGEGVTLHPFDEEDFAYCRDLLQDADVRRGLSIRYPLTEEDQREFRRENDDTISFVIRASDGAAESEDDEPDQRVGVVDLVHLDQEGGNVEVGYFLDPDSWGNGYATAAVECVVAYAFRELRIHKVYARVFEFNDASARVLERAGFEREAVIPDHVYLDGEYVDVLRYGRFEDA